MTCGARVISRLPFLPWKLPHWFAFRLSFSSISLSDILFCVCVCVSAWALLDSYLECSFCMIHYRRRCMRERGRRSSFESRKGWAGETRTEGKKKATNGREREEEARQAHTRAQSLPGSIEATRSLSVPSMFICCVLARVTRTPPAANRCMTQKKLLTG